MSSIEFVAYDTKLLKLIFSCVNGKTTVNVEGLLSSFFKKKKKQFDPYLKFLPAEIRGDTLYLSTTLPPIPSKPFERLVYSQVKRTLGFHSPDNLTIMVTKNCQCQCKHCLVNHMEEGSELSKNEIFGVIDQAQKLGVSQITFEGGEPTLREDLPKLIRHIDKTKATSMVVTNGQRLTEDYVRNLRKSGLDYMNISIDSPHPMEHDIFRGVSGLFTDASKGIRNSVSSGILTGILYIARPGNCDRETLKKLVSSCRELRVFELLIDKIVASGRWTGKDVLTEEQEEALIKFQRETAQVEGKNLITNFFQFKKPAVFGCFAGRRWCYVSPSGEVMPCMHTPISFGNVKKEQLSEIWRKIRKHPLFNRTPKVCAYEEAMYKENYLKKIIGKGTMPYHIEELDLV